MKKIFLMKICLVLLILFFLQNIAFALDDFDDILFELPIQRPASDTQSLDTTLYAASVRMTLRDGDGNNRNFRNGDVMESLTLRSSSGTLEFPSNSNRDEVIQFAKENANEIIRILFPGACISCQTMGPPENMINTALTFEEAITPIKKPRVTLKEIAFGKELDGRLEYSDFELTNDSGNSIGALFGYRHRSFSNKLEIGLLVPYRFTYLDDHVDTTAHFLQMDLFGKYTIYEDKGMTITAGGDLFSSLLVTESNAFDVLGNLSYGSGIFVSAEKDFKLAILTGGIAFKLSQVTFPDGLLTDDLDFLAEGISDREPDKDLVYGLNIAMPYKENLMINLNAHRINSFSSDIPDNLDSQTKIRAAVQYAISKTFGLDAGYSTVFELEDYTPHTFFLTTVWQF
ncbi:MAG: hypothetical protein GY774_39510 [Planctomycetes bacterium]|nr:hypothetical protein [Planctomycetota bacterium]